MAFFKTTSRVPVIALVLAACWLFYPAQSWAEKAYTYKSRYITVHYQNPKHFAEFARKIAPGAVSRKLTHFLASSPTTTSTGLGKYLDALLKRVQMLLDMPSSRMTVTIKILASEKEVQAHFNKVTGGVKHQYHSRRPPAFYAKKDNTVYIQTKRLHTGMLAHEMAHAVMLYYFRVPPPLKIQEMLAIYVDREISRRR